MIANTRFRLVTWILIVAFHMNLISGMMMDSDGADFVKSLIISELPAEALQATNKAYVDSQIDTAKNSVLDTLLGIQMSSKTVRIVAQNIVPNSEVTVVPVPPLISPITSLERIYIGAAVDSGDTQTVSFTDGSNSVEVRTHVHMPATPSNATSINVIAIDKLRESASMQVFRVPFDVTVPTTKPLPMTSPNIPLIFGGGNYPQAELWMNLIGTTTTYNLNCRELNNLSRTCNNTSILAIDETFSVDPTILQYGRHTGAYAREEIFSVTFPVQFAAIPVVDVQTQEVDGNGLTYCGVRSVSQSGFTGSCGYTADTTNIQNSINWLAILPGTHYL